MIQSTMLPGSDDYRARLINMILFASSQEQVTLIIDEAVLELDENNVNKDNMARQLANLISDLGQFDPVKKQAQQWNNIKLARVLLRRKWRQLHLSTE